MKSYPVLLALVLCSCSVDEEILSGTLRAVVEDREFVLDNVIACAASSETGDLTHVFLYPRPGATDIRYFETSSLEADKNNFAEYKEVELIPKDVFNGYLKQVDTQVEEGKWVIVSFEEEGKIHLCNPIRIKKDSRPTEYLAENVEVADIDSPTPHFSWTDGTYNDTIIYFQVVSTSDDDLLSGTYTQEQMFRYYNTENVTLNITRGAPPDLIIGRSYGFTLMGVSEDNWVNLFSELSFTIQEN
ncbi:hypothetical protein [Ulvibacterium sp.]|uniref:hypothetical protein n=1 Tax=Ulvibacterium sp. TaxID=2665914 RepID=UPI002621A67A|nr:hypothetical protein [Ulvibacterium sp.]